MKESIFKAYDIRGVYPQDFPPGIVERIAAGLVSHTQAKKVLIGADARTSSPEIKKQVIKGLQEQGVQVIDIGLCTTPMFNFAVAQDVTIEAGIMITASHNPPQYNGLKLVRAGAVPIGLGSGLEKIQELAALPLLPQEKPGTVEKREVVAEYLRVVYEKSGLQKGAFRDPVVIDVGNGMFGLLAQRIVDDMALSATILFPQLDGRFPNHEANPVKDATLKDLKAAIRAEKAAIGFALDGDADRIGVVDELGMRVPGDLVGALLAQDLLQKHPGALVLGDVNTGWMLEEVVKQHGGKFERVKVGHANIKREMREKHAVFAAEMSYHFYYQDFWNVESTALTMLRLLKILAESGKSLQELLAPLRRYHASGEVNLEVMEPRELIDRLKEHYAPETESILEIDGIRVECKDWWFSMRASNTEPLVRLNVEAVTKELLEEKLAELIDEVNKQFLL